MPWLLNREATVLGRRWHWTRKPQTLLIFDCHPDISQDRHRARIDALMEWVSPGDHAERPLLSATDPRWLGVDPVGLMFWQTDREGISLVIQDVSNPRAGLSDDASTIWWGLWRYLRLHEGWSLPVYEEEETWEGGTILRPLVYSVAEDR